MLSLPSLTVRSPCSISRLQPLLKTRCFLPVTSLAAVKLLTINRRSKQVRGYNTMSRCQAGSSVQAGSDTRFRGGAFVDHCSDVVIPGNPSGPLAGLTFAVKDLFDLKGYMTGHGNPAWLLSHADVADHHSAAVEALLAAGADALGKTHMDELAYSLNGENFHYGTPLNPEAPDRVPGGSSSGSATAVAMGVCDIGLGSDTGGSVRVPASYTGLCGLRPSHGRVSMEGSRPLAPSFDTAGWMTCDMTTLRRVGDALLDPSTAATPPVPVNRWLVATDAFDLAEPATTQAIYQAMSGAGFEQLCADIGAPTEIKIAKEGDEHIGDLGAWLTTFRTIQAWEVWDCHGKWVEETSPNFGPGIRDRFQMASEVTTAERDAAAEVRELATRHLASLLAPPGTVLMVPSTPGPGPLLDTPQDQLNDFRMKALTLTSIAGLAGCPQLNFPLASVDGAPVGLGVIGARGTDEELLKFGEYLESILPKCPSREKKSVS